VNLGFGVVGGGVGFFKNVSKVLFSFFFVETASWTPGSLLVGEFRLWGGGWRGGLL